MDPHDHADPSPMTDSPVPPALDEPAPQPTPSPTPRRFEPSDLFATALLSAMAMGSDARPRTEGERELAAVQSITRALADLPEASRRKVLNTVEDYVVVPPRRARQAAAPEAT